MAQVFNLFIHPADEAAFLGQFAKYELSLYPEYVPPDWAPPLVNAEAIATMNSQESAWYLAAEKMDEITAYPIKRGPYKGFLKIEEVPSPVFYYERSFINDKNELVAGKLWVELEGIDGLAQGRPKPYGLKVIYNELNNWINKTYRRSIPKGAWISPKAAAKWKAGELTLRLAGHHAGTVSVWK